MANIPILKGFIHPSQTGGFSSLVPWSPWSTMGLLLRVLLVSLPVILGIFLAPSPELILGGDLGRLVVIARGLGRIVTFMFGIPVTMVHPQFAVLQHVVENMKKEPSTDPLKRTMELVDDYGWNHGWLMNIGDVKGQTVDNALHARLQDQSQPVKLVVELGTFVGYGTLRLARQLNASNAEIITVDPDVMAYAVSSSLYEQAGVRDRITMKTDFSYNVFKELKTQQKQIDFLFIDHVKHLYLSDLKLALEMDLLAKNCVVVADNVLFPGAPDYKDYMSSGEGSKLFETKIHRQHVEYWPSNPDEVAVSTYLGR